MNAEKHNIKDMTYCCDIPAIINHYLKDSSKEIFFRLYINEHSVLAALQWSGKLFWN